jgi:hypothetical protein
MESVLTHEYLKIRKVSVSLNLKKLDSTASEAGDVVSLQRDTSKEIVDGRVCRGLRPGWGGSVNYQPASSSFVS